MKGWKEHKVSELIQSRKLWIGDGYRAKNVELSSNSENAIPFARAGNIDGGFSFGSADFFPVDNLQNIGDKVSKVGDTVFTSKGTVGRFAFVDSTTPRFVYSPQLCFWRSLDTNFISSRFLFYWMQAREFLAQVDAVKGQTDMAEYVSLTDQRQMKITFPELPEQKAIAEVLSSLDDKIDLLHRQNRTLESLAQTLFRQWFIEEADDSWETRTVGDVALINALSVDNYYEHEEIEYLDTGSITDNIISEYQELQLEEAPSRAKRIVKNNDIIISTVRPIHRHYGFLKTTKPNTIVSTGFCVLSCTEIDPHFMYVFLTQKEMTEYFDVVAEGSTSTYPSLKPSDISSVEFKMPPTDLLTKFADYASNAWQKLEVNKEQIRLLTSLRDHLLPKLMSGEVVVT